MMRLKQSILYLSLTISAFDLAPGYLVVVTDHHPNRQLDQLVEA